MLVTVRYSVLAYEKVVKPLYISIADKIRKLKDFIVYLFTVVIKSIKSFLQFIGRLITSFYEAMKSVISHINNLYFFILKSSM
jgi:phage-related protein